MKKLFALILALAMLTCAATAMAEDAAPATPKYVFMFIGDGMGNPQVTATQYYLGALENPDSTIPVPAQLSFTDFENVGLMTTYDASSFCPDSASTATSMASGQKTLSGVINYNIDLTESFKIITEYAKEAGKKVGVISSVSLDHATPAAYYAKSESRGEYYDIALQGVSGTTLDFLGGGSYLTPDGDGTQANLFDVAEENGFTVVNTLEDIRALNSESGRVLAITPDIADSSSMQYEIDRVRMEAEGADSLSLAEMVQAGISVLDNDEEGFFLMTEGGKIDWSCHANDAMTSIGSTIGGIVRPLWADVQLDHNAIVVCDDAADQLGGSPFLFAIRARFQCGAQQAYPFEDFIRINFGRRRRFCQFNLRKQIGPLIFQGEHFLRQRRWRCGPSRGNKFHHRGQFGVDGFYFGL